MGQRTSDKTRLVLLAADDDQDARSTLLLLCELVINVLAKERPAWTIECAVVGSYDAAVAAMESYPADTKFFLITDDNLGSGIASKGGLALIDRFKANGSFTGKNTVLFTRALDRFAAYSLRPELQGVLILDHFPAPDELLDAARSCFFSDKVVSPSE